MDLREYLFRKRISVTDFAKQIDHSRPHLSSIVNGLRQPSPRLARAIEKATSGEVTAKELMENKRKK